MTGYLAETILSRLGCRQSLNFEGCCIKTKVDFGWNWCSFKSQSQNKENTIQQNYKSSRAFKSIRILATDNPRGQFKKLLKATSRWCKDISSTWRFGNHLKGLNLWHLACGSSHPHILFPLQKTINRLTKQNISPFRSFLVLGHLTF